MRLTAIGKLVLLILVVGATVGIWRGWQMFGPAGATGEGQRPGRLEGAKAEPGSGVEIPFVITAAKKDWVQEQVDRFNEQHANKWRITPKPIPSREAMHSILSGKEQPVLWSPGSPIWPSRLAEAWSEKHSGAILDMSDPNAYRVFLRSPLVFLTTRKKAEFLRSRLGGPHGWQELKQLSQKPQSTPWGHFRFSHADPLTSSSGMLTLGLILFDYGQRAGRAGELEKVATDRQFVHYLSDLERSLIYDNPAEKGTTALTKAFLEDTSRYDMITAYESAALEAAPKDPDLAVIYPTPTAVSEHAVSLLSGPWVTPEQREGAIAFMTFLGGREALEAGMKYHFRPVQSSSSLSLAGELSRHAPQGFQQTFSSVELPPYNALNSAAFQWRIYVVRKPPKDEEKL